jgi:hypothetical protein
MKTWCDRRNRVQHISLMMTACIMLGVFTSALASVVAKGTGQDSLVEHSTVIIDVQAYIIIALCGALVAIVLWNVKDLKNTMRTNHDELRKELKNKVSIQIHNAICDKQIRVEAE